MQYKGKEIHPYESFYWDTTQEFFRGELGGGISRCVKTDDSLAVMEEKIIKVGNYSPSGHNASSIVDGKGISPAVMENHGTVTAVVEPLCSVHPNSHKFEFDPETSIKPISPALRATDYKAPHCVYEPRVEQVGNIYPDTETFKNRTMGRVYSDEGLSTTINCCGGGDREPKIVEDWQTVVGNKQLNPFRGSVYGTSPCITSACGAGGGMTPMLTDADLETSKTKEFIEQVRGHEEMRYRIRKLTPRECFRLMGVDDADIDKIQASGISNSQQYKCAGNSIVVDVLYHIFRKMFCETENENDQLCLF